MSDERWGDAVSLWMEMEDAEIDVFSSERCYEPTDVEHLLAVVRRLAAG